MTAPVSSSRAVLSKPRKSLPPKSLRLHRPARLWKPVVEVSVEHRTCDHDHRELGEVARDLDGLDPCGGIVPAGHHPLRLAHHQVAEPAT
jgi:hypothetical protein